MNIPFYLILMLIGSNLVWAILYFKATPSILKVVTTEDKTQ